MAASARAKAPAAATVAIDVAPAFAAASMVCSRIVRLASMKREARSLTSASDFSAQPGRLSSAGTSSSFKSSG